MAKHIQTQTEWESTMAARYGSAAGRVVSRPALPERRPGCPAPCPAASRYHRRGLCRRWCPPVLSACLGAGHLPQKPALPAPGLPAQRAALHLPPPVAAGRPRPHPVGAGLRHRRRKHAGQPEHPGHHPPGGLAAAAGLPAIAEPMRLAGRRACLPRTAGVRRGNADQVAAGVHLRRPPLLACRPGQPAGPDAGQTVGAAGPPDAAEHGGIWPARRRKRRCPRPASASTGQPKPPQLPGFSAQVRCLA